MTTRKAGGLLAALGAIVSGAGGCATPGTLHVYGVSDADFAQVRDRGESANDVPSFLRPAEALTGFAYDPYTDHFFLRLAPGNMVRVVDRPARAIKREFTITAAPTTGGGDLAVKPRTGHLYLLHPTEPAVIETTRLGEPVRTFMLHGLDAPAAGIAYDPRDDRLLVLARDRREVWQYDLSGARYAHVVLARVVGSSLGFDAEKRELYAPVPDGIGVFDEAGKLLRTMPLAATVVDVGPRSLIRVF
jgi:hypothetical protein